MCFFFSLNIKVQLKDSEEKKKKRFRRRLKDSITCLITIPGETMERIIKVSYSWRKKSILRLKA